MNSDLTVHLITFFDFRMISFSLNFISLLHDIQELSACNTINKTHSASHFISYYVLLKRSYFLQSEDISVIQAISFLYQNMFILIQVTFFLSCLSYTKDPQLFISGYLTQGTIICYHNLVVVHRLFPFSHG